MDGFYLVSIQFKHTLAFFSAGNFVSQIITSSFARLVNYNELGVISIED